MSDRSERYAPGWADDAIAMMSSRTARRRATFLLPFLTSGMQLLDVGCGAGTITVGLAQCVAPRGNVLGLDAEASQVELARLEARRAGVSNVSFQIGSAYELPSGDESFDVSFAHGLFEHLARPSDALFELRRVLRPGGVVGICSSDWSRAVVEPRTADVDAALRCHFKLRQQTGGDPLAGGHLPELIQAAGFVNVVTTTADEVDMSYRELARYVGRRIEAALAEADTSEHAELKQGATAARRWAQNENGRFTQHWVATTARKL
jgi:ubiquinone/menaquinone biosynthesis C-methylase UbiE